MTGLSANERTVLERAVAKGRRLLEDNLAAVAEGSFGLYSDGKIDDQSSLRLSPSEFADRGEIVAVLEHLRAQGNSSGESFRRLVREAAFTHLNRLFAIRVAEAIALLPPSLAEGKASTGFREVLEVAPLLGADGTGGYWTYLRLCGDELASDAPVLFDPRNPLLALIPSPPVLDEIVGLLSDPELNQAWAAPDTFGWSYQFFNTAVERREMRESGAPRNSRELAVRNQFFTPRYVVDFLVHNSLGRRLLEADPDSSLKGSLHFLIDPPVERGKPLELDEVKVLDPASGSGHFLLGCYDVLETAWGAQGVGPAQAAARILPAVWGIDIDARCAQVASAALVLRARRHDRDGHLPRPNVITARPLPRDEGVWERVNSTLPAKHRGLVTRLREALEQAPVLGSLLKVEQQLEREIRSVVPEAGLGDTLFRAMGLADDAFGHAEADVLATIQRVADESSSSVSERLFAAEASDAIRFVEAMRQRYDAVLMNPPFGDPIPETKDYLLRKYARIHSKQYNILGPFVERGLDLLNSDGYLGAITSRAAFFLTSFERWRMDIVLSHRLVSLADLGFGVMEGALVEAAAYILGKDSVDQGAPSVFIRLLKDVDKASNLTEAIARERAGSRDTRTYRLDASDFRSVPGAPLAYWMADSLRRLFTELPQLEGSAGEARIGLQTSDDFRFVRAFWEVAPTRIGRSRQETFEGKSWVPFAKGGEYSPFYGDIHLVVDWRDDGKEYWVDINPNIAKPRSNIWMLKGTVSRHFFRPGLTWPRRTNSGFGIRVLPTGSIFADKGPAVFPLGRADAGELLSLLSSRLFQALVDSMVAAGEETTSGGASRSYEVGLIQKLPWPGDLLDDRERRQLADLAEKLAAQRATEDSFDETTRRFVAPRMLFFRTGSIKLAARRSVDESYRHYIEMIEDSYELERLLHRSLRLESDSAAYLNEEVGPHPGSYPVEPLLDEKRFSRLFTKSIDGMIDEVVAEHGGSRALANLTYIADRRLEVLSHAFGRHPRTLAEVRDRLGLLPPEEPTRTAKDLVSYVVGAAFGRWDMRIGIEPDLAPSFPNLFDPVPLCSPGMLVDDAEMPAKGGPAHYPTEPPSDRILLDEPGHRWDIEDIVQRAAAALFDGADAVLAEAVEIIGRRNLREYLRRLFFKDHVRRYTKSRRKAPIYWHLSVPSLSWGVWVYAPKLSRETLFAIEREAARRYASGQELIRALKAERAAGGRGRTLRQVDKQLEDEEGLIDELQTFRIEAERIAEVGWEPDLDDGIVLCAAPLASLFPAWPEATKERDKLRKGEYEWASVARFRGAL